MPRLCTHSAANVAIVLSYEMVPTLKGSLAGFIRGVVRTASSSAGSSSSASSSTCVSVESRRSGGMPLELTAGGGGGAIFESCEGRGVGA